MAVLSAFLPAEQGIAAWANLDRHARALKATGDRRSRGQLMADTLVERLTGQAAAAAVPVEIGLTMTAEALLSAADPDTDSGSGAGGSQTPAELDGYGPIPADLALDLIASGADAATASRTGRTGRTDTPGTNVEARIAVWVRRILTDPVDDTVVAVDTRRRRFDAGLARLIRHRDRVCRDPYCPAPIRHLDHVRPHRAGGPTSAANGAGLCERGNYAKDMPGWTRRVVVATAQQAGPGSSQRLEITTPTGHIYASTPPPALGPGANHQDLRYRRALRRLQSLKLQPPTGTIALLVAPEYGPGRRPTPGDPQVEPP
jgi:hypothetical protein